MTAGTAGCDLHLWQVRIEWSGAPADIERLVAALAHLEPTRVSGTRTVTVGVIAASTVGAEAYVAGVLTLHELTGAARIVRSP